MSEELMVCEIFDSESTNNFPTVNLMPKAKVPQMWGVSLPGSNDLVIRMVSYGSNGDAIKNLKPGEKYAHVILMSLSEKGNIAELKGGLGADPVGALNTIFDQVYSTFKSNHMQAVLFRFPAKKMKGQEKTLQRIMSRLVAKRGNLEVVDEIFANTNKHSYILIKKKGVSLEDIPGIPGIDLQKYTKVDSKVGDVYVNIETGEKVTKDEAIVAGIAEVENKRLDKTVVSRSKISRRQMLEIVRSSDPESELSALSQKDKEAYEELMLTSDQARKGIEPNPILVDAFKTAEEYTKNRIGLMSSHEIPQPQMDLIKNILMETYKGQDYISLITEFLTKLDARSSELEEIKNNILEQHPGAFIPDLKNIKKAMGYEITRNSILSTFETNIWRKEFDSEFTSLQKDALKAYCNDYYSFMNGFLGGRVRNPEPLVIKYIKAMDSAFEHGISIDKDMLLYRSTRMPRDVLKNILEIGKYYSPAFMSTSMAPRVFDEGDVHANIDTKYPVTQVLDENNRDIIVAFVIKGAYKIKTILPGNLSSYSSEQEVILPRGLMFDIKNIQFSNVGFEEDKTKLRYDHKCIIELEVLFDEETGLSESEYEPEVTMDTKSTVETYSFSKFTKHSSLAKELRNNQLKFLASMINPETADYLY